MNKINYIFVSTEISLKIAKKCIDDNQLFLNEYIFVIPSKLRSYFASQFEHIDNSKTYKKRSLSLFLNLIFNSYRHKTETLILCDIGLFNKLLIILMRYDNLYIVDDGLASLNRKNKIVNFLFKVAKVFTGIRGKRVIDFFSIYPKLFTDQIGFFSQSLATDQDNTLGVTYEDTIFYIDSFPFEDGIDEEYENFIVNFKAGYTI